jgi:hypothetical protein
MNLAKAWFLVDNKHTWDNLVDASISIMKYCRGQPQGSLKNRGESCSKPAKNAKRKPNLGSNIKHAHTAQPTPRWPPQPTRAAQQGASSSKVRLARGLTPPSSEVCLARGLTPSRAGFRLARWSPPPLSGLRLTRGFLTGTPAPTRVYGHLML